MQHEGKMLHVPMTFHVPTKPKKWALPGDSIQNSFCVWSNELPKIVEPPKPTMKWSHVLEEDPMSPNPTTKSQNKGGPENPKAKRQQTNLSNTDNWFISFSPLASFFLEDEHYGRIHCKFHFSPPAR